MLYFDVSEVTRITGWTEINTNTNLRDNLKFYTIYKLIYIPKNDK
jgi:hypothetical protein